MSRKSFSSSTRIRPSKEVPPPLPSPPAPAAAQKPWWHLSTTERDVLIASLVFKFLLFPAYRSTDFEVHRNWLAITHSLPLSQWYFDTGSEWTLDYPPFFAYFERFMASFAYLVDPKIVQLDNLGYDAWSVVAFQRTTVVLSELVLTGALLKWARRSMKPDYPTAVIIASSVLLHPGLLIVDHMHFQYNGFLLGLLLWSVVAAREDNLYACAALFAALLNFKHIFIYLAPPYFIFLLRRHCFSKGSECSSSSSRQFQMDRLVELGVIVVSIFALSFGPFLIAGGTAGIRQIFSRLFPFQRGLNHAYWAPNVWALVSAVDRVLVKYLLSRGWPISPSAVTSASRGLIGTIEFGVLPAVTPTVTFSLTLAISLVYLTKLWLDPSYKRFLDSLVLSAFTSFLWGWHVHEKAVLLFLVPLSLTAVEDHDHLRTFIIASTAGVYSLFPLLIKPAETPIKLLASIIWAAVVFPSLRKVVPLPNLFSMLVDYAETFYLYGFIALQLYVGVVHEWIFPSPEVIKPSMEFLPLMLTSLYCALGVVWAWLRLSWVYLSK
ncbi:family 57 glycosyltransferase [Leucosporidium creatinivorum]|uniref:Alpha-1,3-glucosyltransferase n=1 Tax=Leucosporidium creatinivorum TaxID=106004 RepID=A0A1Y2G2T0_9BASI|nr:family 57 glycosyltransferase [Leucosporidium creatinivorum]